MPTGRYGKVANQESVFVRKFENGLVYVNMGALDAGTSTAATVRFPREGYVDGAHCDAGQTAIIEPSDALLLMYSPPR